MSSLVIDPLEGDDSGFEARISIAGLEHVVSLRADQPVSPALGDSLLCATLLPAMAADAGILHIPAAISPSLAQNVEQLQLIFSTWAPNLRPVEVEAETLAAELPTGRRAACFFSGGVDSFYTVLRNLDQLDVLIFVRGFDIAPEQPQLGAVTTDRIRTSSAELGKELIEVDISVRPFSDPLVPWELYHGSLLAAIAHLLGGVADRVLLPATFAMADTLDPWGSHPWTDPLWGSDAVRLVHEGAEANRAEKIRYLAESDVAMRNLRVCWENPEEQYNCGRCQKCLLTMIGLRAVDSLGRCATLPDEVDPMLLTKIAIREGPFQFADRAFVEASLGALAAALPPAPTLKAPLEQVMGNYRRRQAEAYLGPLRPARSDAEAERPAGYRLVDAVSRSFDRLPYVRTAARRAVRGLVDRAG